jgi:hypothetical protein
MSRTLLFECSPRLPADGTTTTRRMVWKARSRADFLGVQWHPVVVTPPSFQTSLGWDGRQFGARPVPQVGRLVFAPSGGLADAARLVWSGAAVTIREAAWPLGSADAADGDFSIVWRGEVEEISVAEGLASLTLIDAGKPLREPLANLKFGQTGNALLDAATADRAAGQVVPRAFGQLFSLPALLVDRLNNIWLVAADPASSVQGIYDGGAAFTMGSARASLAALQSNIPARGAADWCLDADGLFLVRPWDEPVYPLTVDATFGGTKAGEIAEAIIAARTSLNFLAGTLTAFNAAQPAACGLYVDDDSSVAACLDRLFAGLGSWWKVRSGGEIELGQWGFGSPVLTVAAERRGAPERLRVLAPTGRRTLGYARNHRVHGESEIAQILLGDRLAYADGTPIEALRPAEGGATLGDNIQPNWDLRENTAGYNLGAAWERVAAPAGFLTGFVLRNTVAASAPGSALIFPRVRVTPGDFVYIRIKVRRSAALGGLKMVANMFSDPVTGGGIGPLVGAVVTAVPGTVSNTEEFSIFGRCDANTRGIEVWIEDLAGATVGTVWIGDARVASSQQGADVTADTVPRLELPTPQTFQAAFDGTISAGQQPRDLQVRRFRGSVDVTSSTSWSATGVGCTASITSAGLLTISSVTASGRVDITGTRDGVPVSGSVETRVARADPPPASGSPTASGSISLSSDSASFVTAVTATVTTTASGTSVSISSDVFTVGDAGFANTEVVWQRETSPGTWSDVGAVVVPDFYSEYFGFEFGYASISRTVTGLASSTAHNFRLRVRRTSAPVANQNYSGSYTLAAT